LECFVLMVTQWLQSRERISGTLYYILRGTIVKQQKEEKDTGLDLLQIQPSVYSYLARSVNTSYQTSCGGKVWPWPNVDES